MNGLDAPCEPRYMGRAVRNLVRNALRFAKDRVEVAVANHHAYFDAIGAESVRALQPLVWVVPAWHITHLNIAGLERMVSERFYAGPRDVFATDLMPATQLMNERFMKKVASVSGLTVNENAVAFVPIRQKRLELHALGHTSQDQRFQKAIRRRISVLATPAARSQSNLSGP